MDPIEDLRPGSGLLECGLGEYTALSPEALQAYQASDPPGLDPLMTRFLRDNRQLMLEAGTWTVALHHTPINLSRPAARYKVCGC